jgi:hypothetical protein
MLTAEVIPLLLPVHKGLKQKRGQQRRLKGKKGQTLERERSQFTEGHAHRPPGSVVSYALAQAPFA